MAMDSWFRLSYPRRLFLWLLGYSLLLLGCFIGFQYHREKEFKAEELNAQLQLLNTHILADLYAGKDIAHVRASQPHPFSELRVSIIDNTGSVVYDNSLDSIPADNHLSRHEIAKAITDGQGFTVRRHSESTGNTYFYSATRGRDGLIVRTAVPYSLSLDSLLKADYGFLWIMGGVALAMCMLGYLATRRVGLHIRRLNRFAERAERGERIYDTAPFPKDELGSISSHIVRLYANLQRAIADRDREHQSALREQNEKQRIKKQLTNNINHELKTPVAAIQLCIETLLSHPDMDSSRRTAFLRRCLSNSERLRRLLEDVSTLTRMEDAPAAIAMEEVDLPALISEVIDDEKPRAEAEGMVITTRMPEHLPFKGNPALLASVFRNLIDNALAYSGGSVVSIELTRSVSGGIMACVGDDGCGVAAEHLPHLFERFYRIDKGRSRKEGGTGLGLAIVKNAVLLHGGDISVESRKPSGLIFYISFPCQPAVGRTG